MKHSVKRNETRFPTCGFTMLRLETRMKQRGIVVQAERRASTEGAVAALQVADEVTYDAHGALMQRGWHQLEGVGGQRNLAQVDAGGASCLQVR